MICVADLQFSIGNEWYAVRNETKTVLALFLSKIDAYTFADKTQIDSPVSQYEVFKIRVL